MVSRDVERRASDRHQGLLKGRSGKFLTADLLDSREWGLTSSGQLSFLLAVAQLTDWGHSLSPPVGSRLNPNRSRKPRGGGGGQRRKEGHESVEC